MTEPTEEKSTSTTNENDTQHYEVVSEYRIGEGAPPIALVVLFAIIVIWAATSWIPFFGY